VVVADKAIEQDFFMFLRNMQLDGVLGAIYFDEVHSIVEDQHYRPALRKIYKLSLPVQYICMTATLPPSMKERFEFDMCFGDLQPHYIRAPSYKPRMEYRVVAIPDGSMVENAIAFIASQSEKFRNNGSDRKIMVFCSMKSACDELSHALSCSKYYSSYIDKQ